MAALNLNTVRSTIEKRLADDMTSGPAIPIAFQNVSYRPAAKKSWIQCNVSFGNSEYMAPGLNKLVGVLVINIFTPQGRGSGPNLKIGKRVRDLYNNVNVSGVYFDAPIGPEVLAVSAPEGYFQTQVRATFETFEEL